MPGVPAVTVIHVVAGVAVHVQAVPADTAIGAAGPPALDEDAPAGVIVTAQPLAWLTV